MGNLFRSEEMSLVQLIIQFESAHEVVSELGHLGMVQFRDLNAGVNPFQRKFVNDVRRCEEMERKLRFLSKEIERAGLKIQEDVLELDTSAHRSQQEAQELETKLVRLESEMTNMNRHEEALQKSFQELTEMKYVVQLVDKTLNSTNRTTSTSEPLRLEDDNIGLVQAGDIQMDTLRSAATAAAGGDFTDSSRLSFLAGVIPRSRVFQFERMMWRQLRGNLVMRVEEIKEVIREAENKLLPVEKNSFVVFIQGSALQNKIRKICESFGATLYPCPDGDQERYALASHVKARLTDLESVIGKTTSHRKRILQALSTQMQAATQLVLMEKSTYNTLNHFNFDTSSKVLVAEGWCPTKSLVDIQVALETARERSQSVVSTVVHVLKPKEMPPTFHRTNKFTKSFQVIVDAYGVGRYQEVNPAVFSLITFPFLFAVMFGDFGHGFLMTFVAVYIVYYEKSLTKAAKGNEIFGMVYGGRYIILLMGIFSIYTGLIYNDIFSKTMEIFGHSAWEFVEVNNSTQEGVNTGRVYPIGVDPAWHGTDNQLIFSNSYKMKMSVIFGVIQMTFGIILSLFNHQFYKDKISIYNEFIPQVLFLESIFGYLVLCILYKWSVPWDNAPPPSLLNMLIDMFLSPGTIKPNGRLYAGQENVQVVLLLIALFCIPWMLLVKPFLLRSMHNKKKNPAYGNIQEAQVEHHEESGEHIDEAAHEEEEEVDIHGGHGHGEAFDFGEVFVHQTIHTIEFCLGCISNTASYLRLWALSLAHAQLSDVLWSMTISQMFSYGGILGAIGLVIAFAAWFALTIFILLVMEGLSAFLHALRLHWVEFNNKFYKGDGYSFRPFSFDNLSDEEE